MQKPFRVVIIGAGTIATTLADHLIRRDGTEVLAIIVRDLATRATDGRHAALYRDSLQGFGPGDVDLIVEAAVADSVIRFGPQAVALADFCIFSCTALADEAFRTALCAQAAAHGHRVCVPHGAVLGLDGLADGASILESVRITTTKSGKSLGIDPDFEGEVYAGPALGACQRFPRNVNVHAAVALAGTGFERTESRILAVPGLKQNLHRIEAKGPGLAWDLQISSESLGGVTGSYTPLSAIGSVERILSDRPLIIV